MTSQCPSVRRRARAAVAALAAVLAISISAAGAEPRRFGIEPDATDISFWATSRLMNARGRFHRVTGELQVDPSDFSSARVAMVIEAASIDTGIGLRDRHLRSDDFLDVTRFPTISFESIRIEGAGRRATVTGRLTLHGVTREITVPVDVAVSDVALIASGEFLISRSEYGINYESVINPIGDTVRVSFTVRARAA